MTNNLIGCCDCSTTQSGGGSVPVTGPVGTGSTVTPGGTSVESGNGTVTTIPSTQTGGGGALENITESAPLGIPFNYWLLAAIALGAVLIAKNKKKQTRRRATKKKPVKRRR